MQLLFADQLGPHFAIEDEILLPEVVGQFRKRSYHRQKAHLILYAIRARAREAGVRLVQLDSYRDIADLNLGGLTAVHPSSREMLALTDSLG
ncbi:MAG: cryptochrome/photolyase family protein, partial [Aquiluna sp.]